MTVFITGGCKNGKSTFALQCALSLSERRPRYYVATMEPPCDADELERIRIHRAARAGKGFVTLEQGRNLPVCLEQADHSGVFLLDSVTALLANEMFPKKRGVITSVVMIASSVANYLVVSVAGVLTRIGGIESSQLVLLFNMAVMLNGILLALYLNVSLKRERPGAVEAAAAMEAQR